MLSYINIDWNQSNSYIYFVHCSCIVFYTVFVSFFCCIIYIYIMFFTFSCPLVFFFVTNYCNFWFFCILLADLKRNEINNHVEFHMKKKDTHILYSHSYSIFFFLIYFNVFLYFPFFVFSCTE